MWCSYAPGLSAWRECSTVVSKNVLSGAYFFGRPTPALFARVLTFTKVACTVLTGSTHSQRSQHLQAAHSFTLANSVALLRGTSPKQAFSISQSVSERCAGTVNTDEITKRIDGFIQQATLSRVLLVPIRVVPGVVWRNVRLATRRAKVPMCYLHKWNASCLQHVHCFTHPGEKPLLLLWGPASRK